MKVDLKQDGLLWLINRVVFHPRGYALAAGTGTEEGQFFLHGDGSEPWRFDEAVEDGKFGDAQSTLARATIFND